MYMYWRNDLFCKVAAFRYINRLLQLRKHMISSKKNPMCQIFCFLIFKPYFEKKPHEIGSRKYGPTMKYL